MSLRTEQGAAPGWRPRNDAAPVSKSEHCVLFQLVARCTKGKRTIACSCLEGMLCHRCREVEEGGGNAYRGKHTIQVADELYLVAQDQMTRPTYSFI